ncbi:zinc finger domain containing protein, partial [Entamoeba invadens IP1]
MESERLEVLNTSVKQSTLVIKSYVVSNSNILCLTSSNSLIVYNTETKNVVFHTPPPLTKSAPVISVDFLDNFVVTISSDFTVLVIDLVSYKVYYRQTISNAVEAKFINTKIFTVYSSDKTLRVVEYPDTSLLGFGKSGHVDVLSNSCVACTPAKTKDVGQFLLATGKSVFLWLCDLEDQKLGGPGTQYSESKFTSPPTEYYLYKKLKTISSEPILDFQKSELNPTFSIFENGVISFYEEKVVKNSFSVNLVRELSVVRPKKIITLESFVLAQYPESLKIASAGGEKVLLSELYIEMCASNSTHLVYLSKGEFYKSELPTEDDLIEESGDVESQIAICLQSKESKRMASKGIKLVVDQAKKGVRVIDLSIAFNCIDEVLVACSQQLTNITDKALQEVLTKNINELYKYISEVLRTGKPLKLTKNSVWEYFVYTLSEPDYIDSDMVLAYYSDLLNSASVISICIEYSRYQTIFSLYKSIGKRTVDAFQIVSHNFIVNGITPNMLANPKQQENFKLLLQAVERCLAEGDESLVLETLFTKNKGMMLIESFILLNRDKTVEMMREVKTKISVLNGYIETLKSPIKEVKECVSREIVMMQMSEKGLLESIFIILT